MLTQTYTHDKPLLLESGKTIHSLQLAYSTAGTLNEEKDNVVWIFHALTANSNPLEWWMGLVGEDKLFDPDKFFLVCVNMPGSCYGSTSPLNINPQKGEPYYHHFPLFTTRDMIRSYQDLRKHLGIEKIFIGIGGSMGGQQLLEWAIEEPDLFQHIIPIATNAAHSPWGIAFNSSQRMSIELDPTWKLKSPTAGLEGLKVARSIALLSYRHYDTYLHSQQGIKKTKQPPHVDEQIFNAETYQRYQGEKLAARFNAFSYYFLSKSMDTHDVGRGRGSAKDALQRIKANTLTIGIATDILFPLTEQEFISQHIPKAEFRSIFSLFGHDGFLLEFEQIGEMIRLFVGSEHF